RCWIELVTVVVVARKRGQHKRRAGVEFEQISGATVEIYDQSSSTAGFRNDFQIDEIDLTGVAVEALNFLADAVHEVQLDVLASNCGGTGGIDEGIDNHEIPLVFVIGAVK